MDLHLKKVMTYFVEFVQDKEKTETPPPGLCSPFLEQMIVSRLLGAWWLMLIARNLVL